MFPSRSRTRPAPLAALLLAMLALGCHAGPLPTTLSSKSESKSATGCAVGDVVYGAGEEFPGARACERCACAPGGAVRCARQQCAALPGCKALHRPDDCCPTYQCECEQDGRVYANGEKLVDPADPCKVCYCQGGEVVCRRIACFLRNDCEPRLVPGRCCPEYDHCPLRGVTTESGTSGNDTVTSVSSAKISENVEEKLPEPKETVKKEITIKEITPVSEIPAISGIKIKEVLPATNIEINEYSYDSTSRSSLVPREVTTENVLTIQPEVPKETKVEDITKKPKLFVSSSTTETSTDNLVALSGSTQKSIINEDKSTIENEPSKINLSTHYFKEDDKKIVNTTIKENTKLTSSTNAPIVESSYAPITDDDDPGVFEHNPAFPPLPDDLSVLSNHDELDIVQDLNSEHGHSLNQPESVSYSSDSPVPSIQDFSVSTKIVPGVLQFVKNKTSDANESTVIPEDWLKNNKTDTEESVSAGGSMLNLRSAIPTDILNLPSALPEIINGELDEPSERPEPDIEIERKQLEATTSDEIVPWTDHDKAIKNSNAVIANSESMHASTGTDKTSNVVTETSSSQNDAASELNNAKETKYTKPDDLTQAVPSTTDLESSVFEDANIDQTTAKAILLKDIQDPYTSDDLLIQSTTTFPFVDHKTVSETMAQNIPTTTLKFESVQPTETSNTFQTAPSESITADPVSSTVDVEIIKEIDSTNVNKSEAIIATPNAKNNNVLTDLINLVGDVASIGDHTEKPKLNTPQTTADMFGISNSEELLPLNSGNKKHDGKNNNWNSNSITELPKKDSTKSPIGKLKTVELVEEETDGITDAPTINDRVEPTTHRAIIDNVSETLPDDKTVMKDIEIITKSYVPTLNRRPTKVVMKKNSEKPEADSSLLQTNKGETSSESVTDDGIADSNENEGLASAIPEITDANEAEKVSSVTDNTTPNPLGA